MTFKLISESVFPVGTRPLIEHKEVKGKTYIEGIFAQADVVNENRHYYPLDVMKEAVARYTERYINTNRAIGELNHPEYLDPNIENACIKVESLEFDGTNIIGRARVLENLPKGKIVKGLIESDVSFGVSTRGAGDLKEDKDLKAGIITEGFELFAVDVVSTPAAPEAYVNGVLESVNIIKRNGKFVAAEAREQRETIDVVDEIMKIVRKQA